MLKNVFWYKINRMGKEINDKKAKDKAHQEFLKLLAKQKKPANPFGVVRSQIYPIKETKPGGDVV